MKHEAQTLIDESGVEVLVGFDYNKEPLHKEEGHGFHQTEGGIDVSLTSVEIVIAGTGIDILPRMTERQRSKIIDQLVF